MPRTITSRAVRSYRTLSPLPVSRRTIGGILSAALVVGSRPPDVIWHPALWSPDFPPLCPSVLEVHNDKAAIVWPSRGAHYMKNCAFTPLLLNKSNELILPTQCQFI